MTPTSDSQRIEGRPYKDYGYSPVETSIPAAVYASTTLEGTPEEPDSGSNIFTRNYQRFEIGMTERGSKTLQYAATAAGNLCAVTAGAMMGWTSPILPRLAELPIADDNPLGHAITENQSSWIGSLMAMGAIFGGLAAGFVAERYGRQRAMLYSVVPFVIGWVLVATTTSVAQLYAARLIFGFAIGFPFTALPMYIGEITETSIRGSMGSLMQFFISLGLLYSYCIGPYVTYTILWIACMCVPVVFLLAFITMPESPYFLLSKGRKEDAIKSMARLRGKSAAAVQKETDEMQAVVEEAYRHQGTFADLFRVKANFKALMLTCALVGFQQFTGINVVLFYTESIFRSTGTDLSSSISTIIVGAVMMGASLVTPVVVDRLGRRFLLILSAVGETITLMALGLFFYLKDVKQSDVSNIGWLPVTSLVVFISVYSVGWGPLPWTVMGEMFASDIKSKASSVTVCFCWALAFCITKFFSNVEAALGTHFAFWIFGIFCAVSAAFVIFLLPETKGKSLQEIQDELNGHPRIRGFEAPVKN